MLGELVRRLVRLVRPRSGAMLESPDAIGWLVRMGLAPAIRGTLWWVLRWRFRSGTLPIFVGRRVTVLYADRLRLGRSVFIGDGVRINAYTAHGIDIGEGVTIREGGWIQGSSSPTLPGERLHIGARTYIGPGLILGIGGPIVIGRDCQLGAGVVLIAENHADTHADVGEPVPVTRHGISVGDRTWIGHRAVLLDGVSLGEDCVVGAGAVVTRSFPAGTRLAGVPARPIGTSEPSSH